MSDSIEASTVGWAKANYRKVLSDLFPLSVYPKHIKPFSIFMAGSPGVGKTEFSNGLIKTLSNIDNPESVIHLDLDAFRDKFEEYDGKNSSSVKRACTILFEKSFDYVQKNSQNVIVDITFASPKSIEDVKRSVNRSRSVNISYLYQNPLTAWEYTKKREKLEGRVVPKKVFIDAYFDSRKNVETAKEIFKEKLTLDLYVKAEDNSIEKTYFNIQSISGYLKEVYTREQLESSLPDTV